MASAELARFVALHDVPEAGSAAIANPAFAVIVARSPNGVVLVFNRHRKVWELPGGFIDPGESARDSAVRELAEEAGCVARHVAWLGLVEIADAATHFGAVFGCEVESVPAAFECDEIAGVAEWGRERPLFPLGDCDAALLNRFA